MITNIYLGVIQSRHLLEVAIQVFRGANQNASLFESYITCHFSGMSLVLQLFR